MSSSVSSRSLANQAARAAVGRAVTGCAMRGPSCQHAVMGDCNQPVVVVGAGIAGLTAAALLAHAGLEVVLLEAHHQSGGCAGTFRRGPYTFDVGATQVAGLESGGSHARLFAHLGIPLPAATPLDPGCVVDLGDGSPAVSLWRDPQRWRQERKRQFPGSERFWQLCSWLHQTNWSFAARDPVLPPRTGWDLAQLLGALGAGNLVSAPLAAATVADLQRLCGCGGDQRLRRFLDLQLRLYSQEPTDRTAALYGATVLAMAQEPLGLWHLEGSMQVLSSALEQGLRAAGGQLRLRHRVSALRRQANGGWLVEGERAGGRAPAGQATVIASVFTAARPWFSGDRQGYEAAKQQAMEGIRRGLERGLGLDPSAWLHQELATPRGFARWTGRPFGFVGGLGQRPRLFGPFGLASRTPIPGLWLCGDAIYPGEGTAGVSLSALMCCRQLLAGRGQQLALA